MKYQLSLLACFLILPSLKTQDYLPIAVEGAHWIIFSINDQGANHHVFHINGDTTIDNRDYKKCYRTDIKNEVIHFDEFEPPFLYDETRLIGAMRDDIDLRQVYYYPFENAYPPFDGFPFAHDSCDILNELFVYDFALEPGAVLEDCFHYDPTSPQMVDSIYYETRYGNNRKHLFGASFITPLIEGIGTEFGPFWNVGLAPHPASPTVLYGYCLGSNEYCGLIFTSNRERINHWETSIYPNPFFDQLTIDLPVEMEFPLYISMHSSAGILFHQTTFFEQQTVLNLSFKQFPSGVYSITFQNKNGASSKRVVKTDK